MKTFVSPLTTFQYFIICKWKVFPFPRPPVKRDFSSEYFLRIKCFLMRNFCISSSFSIGTVKGSIESFDGKLKYSKQFVCFPRRVVMSGNNLYRNVKEDINLFARISLLGFSLGMVFDTLFPRAHKRVKSALITPSYVHTYPSSISFCELFKYLEISRIKAMSMWCEFQYSPCYGLQFFQEYKLE